MSYPGSGSGDKVNNVQVMSEGKDDTLGKTATLMAVSFQGGVQKAW